METTVFVFNSRCINVDGYCTFQHGLSGKQTPLFYKNACMLPFEISCISLNPDKTTAPPMEEKLLARQRIWEHVHLDDYPCGACALYELNKMNITSIKIVGRGNPTARKIKDTAFFRSLLDSLSDTKLSKVDFRNYARNLYHKTYSRTCRPYMCHFPSVMK
jgi:collagenase-like PrtC family protease